MKVWYKNENFLKIWSYEKYNETVQFWSKNEYENLTDLIF